MRLIFVASILAVVFLQSRARLGENQQHSANSKEQSLTKPSSGDTRKSTPPPVTNPSTQKEERIKEQRQGVPGLWDIYWPTLALVIVGLIAAYIGMRTLRDIRKQTRAMKETADATAKSVNALMDAERALIVVLWDNYVHVNPEKHNVLSHCFRCYFRNASKSPAFIEFVSTRFICVKTLDELPPEPSYSPPRDVSHEFEPLLPGEKSDLVYAPIESNLAYNELEAERKEGKCFLYAYGFVAYRDIHGRVHQTNFGVIYEGERTSGSRFRLAGPPTYNRFT